MREKHSYGNMTDDRFRSLVAKRQFSAHIGLDERVKMLCIEKDGMMACQLMFEPQPQPRQNEKTRFTTQSKSLKKAITDETFQKQLIEDFLGTPMGASLLGMIRDSGQMSMVLSLPHLKGFKGDKMEYHRYQSTPDLSNLFKGVEDAVFQKKGALSDSIVSSWWVSERFRGPLTFVIIGSCVYNEDLHSEFRRLMLNPAFFKKTWE